MMKLSIELCTVVLATAHLFAYGGDTKLRFEVANPIQPFPAPKIELRIPLQPYFEITPRESEIDPIHLAILRVSISQNQLAATLADLKAGRSPTRGRNGQSGSYLNSEQLAHLLRLRVAKLRDIIPTIPSEDRWSVTRAHDMIIAAAMTLEELEGISKERRRVEDAKP